MVNNKHLDLFSGIGGFALAAHWAGFQTVQFVENEPYCQKVLQKNFPGVPIHGDIHEFKANKYLGIRLLTGGFPCQPYSQAGKRRGSEDDRAIWPQMFRIVCECRPDFILGENVVGIVQMELDNVLSDLEGEGYTCQSFIIPACAKDARHRRDRVWILAHSKHGSDRTIGGEESKKNCIQGISRSEGCGGMPGGAGGDSETLAYSNSGFSDRKEKEVCTGGNTTDNGGEDVAYSECNTEGTTHRSNIGFSGRGWEEQSVCEGNQVGSNTGNSSENVPDPNNIRSKVRHPKRTEQAGQGETDNALSCSEVIPNSNNERLEGHDDRGSSPFQAESISSDFGAEDQCDWGNVWLPEPGVGRVAHGIPRRVDRLKGLGNAIVPQVAYEFLRLLKN